MSAEKLYKGEIITFYSFKGGTGRTMALANVAVLTSRIASKVLMIDWDLEAPGLHNYFMPYLDEKPKPSSYGRGLIDFFIEVDKFIRSGDDIDLKTVFNKIDINDYIIETTIDGLFLMTAGDFSKDYVRNINSFEWEILFDNSSDFFVQFSTYLKGQFDYIFIDSRTGYTDTSGICTMLLPEKLCLVFSTNRQSLEGVTELAEKALEYRLNSNDFRPLKIYPIPSRIELAEKELREIWRKGSEDNSIRGFQPAFEEIFNNFYGIVNCDLTNYFDQIQILHEPQYSYGENIAVLNESFSDRLSLTNVYSNFIQKLLIEPIIYQIKPIFKGRKERKTRIFLSFTLAELHIANQLKKTLTKFDSSLYFYESYDLDYNNISSFEKVKENIDRADVFIPLISKAYNESFRVQFEISSLLNFHLTEGNKLILPIVIELNQSEVPNVFASMNYLFFDQTKMEIQKLALELFKSIRIHKQSYLEIDENKHVQLTPNELIFLKWVCTDLSYKEIADKMHVSPRTIDSYRDSLHEKLDVKSRVGMAMYAIKNGIVSIL